MAGEDVFPVLNEGDGHEQVKAEGAGDLHADGSVGDEEVRDGCPDPRRGVIGAIHGQWGARVRQEQSPGQTSEAVGCGAGRAFGGDEGAVRGGGVEGVEAEGVREGLCPGGGRGQDRDDRGGSGE